MNSPSRPLSAWSTVWPASFRPLRTKRCDFGIVLDQQDPHRVPPPRRDPRMRMILAVRHSCPRTGLPPAAGRIDSNPARGASGVRPPADLDRRSRSRPSRTTVSRRVWPGGTAATVRTRAREVSIRSPLMATTRSPWRSPARPAGLLRSTPAIITPRRPLRPSSATSPAPRRRASRARPPVPLQLLDHRPGEIGRRGEADPGRGAGGRVDRGVDADHLARRVEQRAAGIAGVDRGIGLDEVVEGAGADLPPAGRDDARGDGAAEAEGIARRQHPGPDPGGGGRAPGHREQRRAPRPSAEARSVSSSVPTTRAV